MAAYSAWKRDMVQVLLGRAGLEVEVAPILTTAPHTRRRVGLHARKPGKQVELGYKARRSWSLVPIHTCTIADPAIVKALPQLKLLAAPLFEHPEIGADPARHRLADRPRHRYFRRRAQ